MGRSSNTPARRWGAGRGPGSRGRCSLAVGGIQVVRRFGGAFECAADHGFAFFRRCIVQVTSEVGGGVVFEGADVPGAHVSPRAAARRSSHWPPTARSEGKQHPFAQELEAPEHGRHAPADPVDRFRRPTGGRHTIAPTPTAPAWTTARQTDPLRRRGSARASIVSGTGVRVG